jgi:hypothetical protein
MLLLRIILLKYHWENGFANLWSGNKITKKAHAGRGQETIWEMSGKFPPIQPHPL